MKKTISVILAIAMMFVMCVPAFAGNAVDALATDQQKAFGEAILSAYNDGYTSVSSSAANSVANGVIANFKEFIPLADIDTVTLSADLFAAFTAAWEDITPAQLSADNPAVSIGNISRPIPSLVGLVEGAVKAEVVANTRVWGSECDRLIDEQAEIAQLILDALNDDSLGIDVTTESGRTDLAQYVYDNFSDLEAYYAIYVENTSACSNDAAYAVRAVWLDNSSVLTSNQDEVTAAVAKVFEDDFSAREGGEGGSGDIWSQLEEGLKKFFEGFTNGDINDMFGGMGESLNQITSAISGLLGGIFGGGTTPTTPTTPSTTNPSNSDDDSFSDTQTGDVAVYSVAGVALVAGLALVLTRKKKD